MRKSDLKNLELLRPIEKHITLHIILWKDQQI